MKQLCMNVLARVCIDVSQILAREAASELMPGTCNSQHLSLACRGKAHACKLYDSTLH